MTIVKLLYFKEFLDEQHFLHLISKKYKEEAIEYLNDNNITIDGNVVYSPVVEKEYKNLAQIKETINNLIMYHHFSLQQNLFAD